MSTVKLEIHVNGQGATIHIDGEANDVLSFYDKLYSSGLLTPSSFGSCETIEAINSPVLSSGEASLIKEEGKEPLSAQKENGTDSDTEVPLSALPQDSSTEGESSPLSDETAWTLASIIEKGSAFFPCGMADCRSAVRDTGWGKTGQPDLPHQYLPGVWPVYLQMAEGAFLLSFLLSEAGVDLPGKHLHHPSSQRVFRCPPAAGLPIYPLFGAV